MAEKDPILKVIKSGSGLPPIEQTSSVSGINIELRAEDNVSNRIKGICSEIFSLNEKKDVNE